MADRELTIDEIEFRRRQLDQEIQEDEIAFLMGLMGRPEMIERTVRREVERRWLAMESLLLQSSRAHRLH
jgi:hypothetical protein